MRPLPLNPFDVMLKISPRIFSVYAINTWIIVCVVLFLTACKDEGPDVEYDPTPYVLETGHFPPPLLPGDNLPTQAGVQLGRMLFYEKALSKDGSISCADCHQQKNLFSDPRQFSIGIDSLTGKRQAMSLFNLAWHSNGLFWDGRVSTLREQALHPIQDPLEMNETLENVIEKLSEQKIYQDQFVRAFGSPEITAEKIGLALEQFEFTIISNDSKYDRWERGEVQLTESEERGRVLFFANADPIMGIKGGECVHCHGGPNFANDFYVNNGLDRDENFSDLGRYEVTLRDQDKAVFKVTSLRNITLTAPYMHDGRFATLDAVIDHYNSGVKHSSTVHHSMDHNLQHGGLHLNAQDKADLIAFLNTLTDERLVEDERFSSPF